MRTIFSLMAFLFFCIPAMADQAEWISQGEALNAAEILSGQSSYLSYCEPCGDQQKTEIAIENLKVEHQADAYYSVVVNSSAIDLAYVFYKNNNQWTNLALSLGLPVEGVSETVGFN